LEKSFIQLIGKKTVIILYKAFIKREVGGYHPKIKIDKNRIIKLKTKRISAAIILLLVGVISTGFIGQEEEPPETETMAKTVVTTEVKNRKNQKT
jgi:hypothetical protein